VTTSEPTAEDAAFDEAVLSSLRAAPAERWAALAAAADALRADPEPMRWAESKIVSTTVVDGIEKPVWSWPYAIYSAAVNDTRRLLDEIGVIHPFDWPGWEARKHYPGGEGLSVAPVTEAARLATAYVRSERFNEGHLGAAAADGSLLAIVVRLLSWKEENP
jgi:hypothetical protein